MQHNKVFSLWATPSPDITAMVEWFGWYEQGSTASMLEWAINQTDWRIPDLAALPPGKRCLSLRWILTYETYVPYGADPIKIFETGTIPTARNIRALRPFSNALKKQGIALDGIYADCEGGFMNWHLTTDMLSTIFRSPKARRHMPPHIRALTPEMFDYHHPLFHDAVDKWNKWTFDLQYAAFRKIMYTSGLFKIPRTPGGPPVQPPMVNFNAANPTFPLMDENRWEIRARTIDGKTGNPVFYFPDNGGRYIPQYCTHAPLWNCFLDHISFMRSYLGRGNSSVWPIIGWPDWKNRWLFEQLIAHGVRTGVNWTASKSAWLYYNPVESIRPTQDPLFAEIVQRHDLPFPVQRRLPRVELDSDFVETAGYVTTYEQFLSEVGAP